MSRPIPPSDPSGRRPDEHTDDARDDAALSHEVEGEIEGIGDPEAGPTLLATTLTAAGRGRDAAVRLLVPSSGITREIVRLGLPVMLSQVLMSIAGIVDRMMIGHLDSGVSPAMALAAVGYATQLFQLIQSALFAVGLACVALMARAIGARNPARSREALISALQVSVVVTVAFVALILGAPRQLLGLLGAEPGVIDAGLPYLRLVVGSSVILSVSIVLDSALRANKDTRTPMFISMVVTAIKLVLNWVLIYGKFGLPVMGLTGAGWATAISQSFGVLLFVAVFLNRPADAPDRVEWRSLLRVNATSREVVRIALPGVGERVVLNFGLLSYFWVLSEAYGTVAVAAYTVGVPLLSFSWIPGSGYAQACATMVGQRLGAGDADGAHRTGINAAWLAIATSLPLGLFYAVFRVPLGEAFTDDQAVIAALGPFMLALAIGQPFLQLHFTLGGAHRGAGDTWTPMLGAALGNWVFRVPLACLFAFVLRWDVVWVWYALVFDHVARSVLLVWSFRRGKWRSDLG
jgi:putative MATE family efflux protein